jgi:hypothetical protein
MSLERAMVTATPVELAAPTPDSPALGKPPTGPGTAALLLICAQGTKPGALTLTHVAWVKVPHR